MPFFLCFTWRDLLWFLTLGFCASFGLSLGFDVYNALSGFVGICRG